MLKVGIIGAENSHCAAIAKICNVTKKVNARVVSVWGETAKFAKAAAEAGQIPNIVKDWRDMLGQVDGVMMDHRHALPHYEVAKFYLSNGVPCFVDKPFTFKLSHAKELCAIAAKQKVALTSYSVIPLQQNFADFKKACKGLGRIAALNTTGPVDLKSKYGGIFFYGIHQVDAIIELLGINVEKVHVARHGADGIATLFYKDGPVVTMNCLKTGCHKFQWQAVGEKEILNWPHVGDESPYLSGAQAFVRMFRTGKEPYSHERMQAPVAVLEAMAKSLKSGKPVRVAKVG